MFKKYFDIGNVVISDHENWTELKFSLNFSDILSNGNKEDHFFKFYTQVKNLKKKSKLLSSKFIINFFSQKIKMSIILSIIFISSI